MLQVCITVQKIVLDDREKCITNRYWVQNVRRERKLPHLNLLHGWRMIVSVRKLVTHAAWYKARVIHWIEVKSYFYSPFNEA